MGFYDGRSPPPPPPPPFLTSTTQDFLEFLKLSRLTVYEMLKQSCPLLQYNVKLHVAWFRHGSISHFELTISIHTSPYRVKPKLPGYCYGRFSVSVKSQQDESFISGCIFKSVAIIATPLIENPNRFPVYTTIWYVVLLNPTARNLYRSGHGTCRGIGRDTRYFLHVCWESTRGRHGQ